MRLTLTIEELLAWHIEAKLNAADGAPMFNFRPSMVPTSKLARPPTDFRLHFEPTVDSQGTKALSISASYTECGWPEYYYDEQLVGWREQVSEPQVVQENHIPEIVGPGCPGSSKDAGGIWPSISPDNYVDLAVGDERPNVGVIDPTNGIFPPASLPNHTAGFLQDYYSSENGIPAAFGSISQTTRFVETGELQSSAAVGYTDTQLEQSGALLHESSDTSLKQSFSSPISFCETAVAPSSPLPVYRPPSPPTTPTSPGASLATSDSSFLSSGVHERVKPRVPCLHPDCERHFKNDYTRSLHMKAHIAKHRRYPCSRCPVVLSRQHDLLRHEVSKHGVEPEFTCSRCSKPFRSEHNMAKHKCIDSSSSRIVWSSQ
ncbi:hypothetical protein C8R43DRAFT_556116 [Mycena crocata]|nr:hypothetical protein C8R43DRAFT_556116 [Mycena crocata]